MRAVCSNIINDASGVKILVVVDNSGLVPLKYSHDSTESNESLSRKSDSIVAHIQHTLSNLHSLGIYNVDFFLSAGAADDQVCHILRHSQLTSFALIRIIFC